jgi:hypothetical protein
MGILTIDQAFNSQTPPPKTSPTDGFIYLMCPEGTQGLYKIGSTINLESRIARMQSKVGYRLYYVFAFFTEDYEVVDRGLRYKYSGHRLAYDWYILDSAAINYIKGLAE